MITTTMPPRMRIIWSILEMAKDIGDDFVISICRRLIVANRLGWRKHASKTDWCANLLRGIENEDHPRHHTFRHRRCPY